MRWPRRKLAVRVALALVAGVAVIGLGVGVLNLGAEASKAAVEAKYAAIKPGMDRTEVRRVVSSLGTMMLTGIGTAELMHIEGRYMIAVVYMPDPKLPPPTPYPDDVPHDDWVVKEKVFLELGRAGRLDNILVGLNLKAPRSVDRTRMPE